MKWLRRFPAFAFVAVIGLYVGAYAWLRITSGKTIRIYTGNHPRIEPIQPHVKITLPPNFDPRTCYRLFQPLLWIDSRATGKDVYLVDPDGHL